MNIKIFFYSFPLKRKSIYTLHPHYIVVSRKGMNVNTAVGRHEKKVFNNMKSRKNCNYIFHDTKRY